MDEDFPVQELKDRVDDLQGTVKVLSHKVDRLEANTETILMLVQQGKGMARLVKFVIAVIGVIGLGTVAHKFTDFVQWLGKA